MRRVLLLVAVACSVLVSGGVAWAQSIPPDLKIEDINGDLNSRLQPSSSYYVRFDVSNEGGSSATFTEGQTIVRANLQGSKTLAGCDVRGTTGNGSSTYYGGGYPNVRCEVQDGIFSLIATGSVVIGLNDYVAPAFTLKTPDADGKIARRTFVDPDQQLSETDESNNSVVLADAYVGSVPATDVELTRRVSVYKRTIEDGGVIFKNDFELSQAVTIVNRGTETAFDVEVTIPHFTGLKLDYAKGNGGEDTNGCREISGYGAVCTDPELQVGERVSFFAYYYGLSAAPVGNYSNSVSASLFNADLDETNNVDSLTYTLREPTVAPEMSKIPNVVAKVNKPVKPVKFTVFDEDAPVKDLKLTAKSSNARLLTANKIAVIGTAENRTIKLMPTKKVTGSSRVTLTATDKDGLKATRTFTVTVKK